MSSRGPDMLELALRRNLAAELELRNFEQRQEQLLKELKASRAQVAAHGGVPPEVPHSRPMTAAIQTYLGLAFWDRAPAEPVPLEVAG